MKNIVTFVFENVKIYKENMSFRNVFDAYDYWIEKDGHELSINEEDKTFVLRVYHESYNGKFYWSKLHD